MLNASTAQTDFCCRHMSIAYSIRATSRSPRASRSSSFPEVRDKLLDAWGIDANVRVGEFSREQNAYLDYHRANVFKEALMKT